MDRYSLTARVYPMILFYLPLSVLLVVTVWDFQEYYHYGIPVGLIGVLAYLTSHLGRDAGKKKEADIWCDWGGAPTTQLFRWRDTHLDKHTKTRNHLKMEQLCAVGHSVDEQFERLNPDDADEVYRAWTKFVIGNTRDINKYTLIYKENMGYGFRRNLLGLKPYAIALIISLILATYGFFVYTSGVWTMGQFPEIFFIAEIFLIIILLFWIIRVTEKWVKLTAFAYAERLHEAIETL